MDEKENTKELIVVDVKHYKKVKKALCESEERYRQLFENVPIGIYRTTPDGLILNANPALVTMLGFTSFAELAKKNVGKDFWAISYSRAAFIAQLERDGEIKGLESLWVKKDGAPIHVRENAKLTRTEDGQVLFEGTVEDITLSKLAESKLLAYQEQLRTLASEITLIEEKERRRIASALHDRIGQNLALCKMKVATVKTSTVAAALSAEWNEIYQLLEQSIHDARSLICELSPPVLYELGFPDALEWLAERIQEQFYIPVEFICKDFRHVLDIDQKVLLFQIVREMLINVGKHSQATQAWVILTAAKSLVTVEVKDDGIGFEVLQSRNQKNHGDAFGFFSVRERLNFLGGSMEIKSKPGQGAHIIISVPHKKKHGLPNRKDS
jgi:PAS domain S-box-containing protein